jgi:hypothetical protein
MGMIFLTIGVFFLCHFDLSHHSLKRAPKALCKDIWGLTRVLGLSWTITYFSGFTIES